MGVDSEKLEYGPETIYAALPSSQGFGVEGQLYSNFLASTVCSTYHVGIIESGI